MKIRATLAVICLSYLSAPLMAQMRIGGGTRSSSSLRGVYSLTLTGRDVNALLAFAKVLDGIVAATFDGQSKVTFSLTNNTNQASGTAAIGSGDTASLSLQSFNGGKNYIVTGRDGAFVYIQISNI